MKRFKFLTVFTFLFVAACSGGVETVTIADTSSVPPTDTAQLTDTSIPRDSVPATDLSLPIATTPATDTAPLAAERELEIITLLPKDGIPAIDNPIFILADEADLQYEPDELIIGVQFDGDARAYSIPMLSSHEIVNDTVGGRKIAVTW